MVMTTDKSNTSDTDRPEWLEEFYEQNHIISNLEYAKLKLSNSAVIFPSIEPITALFDTGATCSCILHQLLTNISDKFNMIKNL